MSRYDELLIVAETGAINDRATGKDVAEALLIVMMRRMGWPKAAKPRMGRVETHPVLRPNREQAQIECTVTATIPLGTLKRTIEVTVVGSKGAWALFPHGGRHLPIAPKSIDEIEQCIHEIILRALANRP